jgi:hypothetical protein
VARPERRGGGKRARHHFCADEEECWGRGPRPWEGAAPIGKHPRVWSLARRMAQLGKAERAIYGEERLPAGLLISMGEEESRWGKAPWEKP